MKNKIKKHKHEILYFVKNAPLAILTSSLPGFVNYAAIIFLTFTHNMEDVGQYRLLMSYFSIIGLFSFQESGKVLVKTIVSNDKIATTTLFFLRLIGILFLTFLLFCIFIFEIVNGSNILPENVLVLALIACFNYPMDFFIVHLQTTKNFSELAKVTFVKYLVSFSVFIIFLFFGATISTATLAQISVMSFFNIAYFMKWLGKDIYQSFQGACNQGGFFNKAEVRESITLSVANWLPSSLEHVDKMIIGYFFGMEILGLYTLSFSTGRFIYNSLKPAFYIYYRQFVDMLPGKNLLNLVFGSFTLFGVFLSVFFYIGMIYIPFFSKFEGGEYVVYILFLSYGIAMADAIYTQSYGINKSTNSQHLLIANTIMSVLCLCMFLLCSMLSSQQALILCALHYPVRHAGTIFLLSWLKNFNRMR